MKLLFSILLLTILGACYTQERPGYTPMDPEDYTDNPLISTLQDAGTAFLLDLAFQQGRIPDTNFTYNSTNYILNRTTEETWYFDFNLTLNNAQNDVIETAFIVRYFPENETNIVGAHTYSVEYGTAESAGGPNSTYVPVPEEQYEDPLIQTMANFGKDFIVDVLIARGSIAPGEYNITVIHSILQQNLTIGARYQFDTYFAQEDGSNARHGEFRILYLNATGFMEVIGHRFSNITSATPVTPDTTGTTPAEEGAPAEEQGNDGTTEEQGEDGEVAADDTTATDETPANEEGELVEPTPDTVVVDATDGFLL